MDEEEQTEAKKGFGKIKEALKNLGGKSTVLTVLVLIILFLVAVIFAIGIVGNRKQTVSRSLTSSPTLIPKPQFDETQITQPPLSPLEADAENLKVELEKINLADPNLAFPNLDFSIDLKQK